MCSSDLRIDRGGNACNRYRHGASVRNKPCLIKHPVVGVHYEAGGGSVEGDLKLLIICAEIDDHSSVSGRRVDGQFQQPFEEWRDGRRAYRFVYDQHKRICSLSEVGDVEGRIAFSVIPLIEEISKIFSAGGFCHGLEIFSCSG